MDWYTVHTKVRQEHQATGNLERLGFETLCPLIRQRKLIRRKMQTVIAPLFPGYIFVRCDLDKSLRAVSFARGVRRLVAFGDTPASIGEDVIDGLRARLSDGFVTIPTASFAPGQCVQIQSGPLQGLEAVFEREMSDRQRVVLLLRSIAARWRVVVPFDQVANG